MKRVVMSEEDFAVIVRFLEGITVPFFKSEKAAQALKALNNAKEEEIKQDSHVE